MHIQRQALDGRLVKPRMPCWHHTHPWGTDLCDDGVPTVAIDVHTRRQSRRSLLAIALPCRAMTDSAIIGVELPPSRHISVSRLAVHRHHIVGAFLDLVGLQYAI